MKTSLIVCIAGLGVMAACGDSGPNYTPILDGQPEPGFAADLEACQTLARSQKQLDQETLAATALGAAAGAALGQADSDDAVGGAVAGALMGGTASAVQAHERREEIVIACMRGRDHAVVG